MSAVTTFAPPARSPWPTLRRFRGLLIAALVFVALFGLVNLVSPAAFGYFDFSYMAAGGGTLALAAIGQTLVILTGGFDLCAGAVISLVNVVLATHLQGTLGSELGWGAAGLAIGAAVGAFNGFFVAFLRLQPIVVTLSTMFIVEGITLLVSDKPGGEVPPDFSAFFTGSVIPDMLPAPIIVLAVVLLAWAALKHSRFGTALYAIGGDEDAARSAGIRVRGAKFGAYVLAGTLYAAAGIFVTAQTASGDPLVGDPLLLQVFAAVVIGGTVLGGGRGGCFGSAIGAYSLMLIVNILLVLNVSAYYGTVAEGIILVLAALGGTFGTMAGNTAGRRSPLAAWLDRLRTRSAADMPLGRRSAPRPRSLVATAAAPPALPPWWRRHAETLRYALPAYVCFVLVLAATVWIYGGLGFGYVNSLLVLSSFLAVLSLGQGAVILTGGLDLSVPWTVALAGILLGGIARGSDAAALWAVPAALGAGALVGLANGVGIVFFRLPPIVVTLAMDGILQGIALVYSNGTPDGFAPPALRWLMTGRLLGVTPVLWLMALFVLGATLLLGRTAFGRRVYGVGNSPRVARLSGVNVGRTLILVYVLSGLCSALVGVLLDGFSGQASLGMGNAYLLPSIAVVVVGGALITGGRGHYLGMIGGVLLLTALQTLLAGTTLPDAVRQIIYGLVVLGAVIALRDRAPG
ncbi:MAG TPA: ABC transporter permease [Stellaceae bacterium]|nr:ABC transporter permease [Stellaceae bacterium]